MNELKLKNITKWIPYMGYIHLFQFKVKKVIINIKQVVDITYDNLQLVKPLVGVIQEVMCQPHCTLHLIQTMFYLEDEMDSVIYLQHLRANYFSKRNVTETRYVQGSEPVGCTLFFLKMFMIICSQDLYNVKQDIS